MVDHPLAMDVEAMRRTGYAAVDALVARLARPVTGVKVGDGTDLHLGRQECHETGNS